MREQADECQPVLADGVGDDGQGRRVVPGHAAPAVAGVQFEEDLGRRLLERPGRAADAGDRVDGERDARAAVGQRRQPGQLAVAHDRRREPEVVEPGRRERLGLVDRGDGQAPGPARCLEPGDLDALVRLGVRPERDALGLGPGLHGVQVGLEPGAVDEERRSREVGDEHAVGGWGRPYPRTARPDPPAT